jgi:hypothetical protein
MHINPKYAEQNRAQLDTAYSAVQQQPGSHCPVLHPLDRSCKAQGSHACLIVAISTEEIAADQSPGHSVYPPARDI